MKSLICFLAGVALELSVLSIANGEELKTYICRGKDPRASLIVGHTSLCQNAPKKTQAMFKRILHDDLVSSLGKVLGEKEFKAQLKMYVCGWEAYSK